MGHLLYIYPRSAVFVPERAAGGRSVREMLWSAWHLDEWESHRTGSLPEGRTGLGKSVKRMPFDPCIMKLYVMHESFSNDLTALCDCSKCGRFCPGDETLQQNCLADIYHSQDDGAVFV